MSRWQGKGRWLLLAVVLGGAAWWGWARRSTSPEAAPPSGAPVTPRLVPAGTRVVVAALNGTTTRGLARRATRLLRDAGFDVVASGNAEPTDSSIVYMHSGDTLWARWAAQAIGGARLIARPDTSRDLHLTVVVGRTWRPPPDPFDP